MTYGQFTGSRNGDCPDRDAPDGVVSLSIEGTQTDGEGRITLCVGRPDLLGRQMVAVGPNADGSMVRVVDFAGAASDCTFTLESGGAITGTASSTGMCGNGSDPAGFALVVDAVLPIARKCGTTTTAGTVTLQGRVAVGPPRV